MRYFSVVFDHKKGKSMHFFALEREPRREEIERHLERMGFKKSIARQFQEYKTEEEYKTTQLALNSGF